jgi:hypothetical protein
MRLLIYLLALVSGFSAADAARAEVSPSASVAQTAVAAAEALAAQEQVTTAIPVNIQPSAEAGFVPLDAPVAAIATTPVSRNDIARK